MSKELTPLQALKELKKRYGKNFSLNDDKRTHIIETALKEKEQHKAIEEELGIDLITLVKALKNGCWVRKGFYGTCYLEGEPVFISNHNLHLNLYSYYSEKKNEDSYEETETKEALCLFDMYYEDVDNIAKVKDYGKTWALTKEELE